MEVQLPVDVGPRRVAEALGLPQRSQVVEHRAAGRCGQHTAEGDRDERDAPGRRHRRRRELSGLAQHHLGTERIDDRGEVSLHHGAGRSREQRGEQRPPPLGHGQLHDPAQRGAGRLATGAGREAGGGPLEPHRADGVATIGRDGPPHVMPPIPQRPRHRRQGVDVSGASRTRTQHPQPTVHRTSLHRNPSSARTIRGPAPNGGVPWSRWARRGQRSAWRSTGSPTSGDPSEPSARLAAGSTVPTSSGWAKRALPHRRARADGRTLAQRRPVDTADVRVVARAGGRRSVRRPGRLDAPDGPRLVAGDVGRLPTGVDRAAHGGDRERRRRRAVGHDHLRTGERWRPAGDRRPGAGRRRRRPPAPGARLPGQR